MQTKQSCTVCSRAANYDWTVSYHEKLLLLLILTAAEAEIGL